MKPLGRIKGVVLLLLFKIMEKTTFLAVQSNFPVNNKIPLFFPQLVDHIVHRKNTSASFLLLSCKKKISEKTPYALTPLT